MSLDLQSLRTAKAALDEGLLDDQDYATVKSSFIKAQSIKAGVEAGFISEQDYTEARKAFFGGLGMIHGAAAAPSVAPAAVEHRTLATPAVKPTTAAPAVNTVQQTSTSPALGKPAATPPAVSKAPPPVTVPQSAPTPEADTPVSASGGSIAPTPTGLTDRGGAQTVADKRSMAGIQVDADAVNILWEVNIKKRYRWVSYHIGQGGKQVEIEKCGAPESTWTEFVDSLPDEKCRYGVFDYEYTNSEGTKFGKLCFVSWAPDEAAVKMKMQHSSTKDFFRSMLEGLAVEIHATDKGDLGETTLRERVAQTVAKK